MKFEQSFLFTCGPSLSEFHLAREFVKTNSGADLNQKFWFFALSSDALIFQAFRGRWALSNGSLIIRGFPFINHQSFGPSKWIYHPTILFQCMLSIVVFFLCLCVLHASAIEVRCSSEGWVSNFLWLVLQEISVDAVEKIMEESAEAIAWHDEVSRILAESLTPEVR